MKKIALIITCMFMISFVSAWSADRSISDNDITITVDDSGGTGVFTIQETVTGASITDYDNVLCGLAGNVLTCDYASVIEYKTSGSGSVAGTITGRDSGAMSSTTKSITGDEIIGGAIINPEIKINEFESNPLGGDSGNQWIELYNPSSLEVDLEDWKIINSNLDEYVLSGTISGKSYLVVNLPGIWLDNEDEQLILKDDSDLKVDDTLFASDIDDNSMTWQRIPNGKDNNVDSDWNFENSTRNSENFRTTQYYEGKDDLMVNYVRGKILINGVYAEEGIDYSIEVLNGENEGQIYYGEVGENIPGFLQDNGYFDSGDQVIFNTDSIFRIRVIGYNCLEEGIFENGGNGLFNPEEDLIELNCFDNNAPVLDSIGNKNVNENQLLEFSVNANDADGDSLDYYAGNLPNGATFTSKTFSWTPDFFQAGEYEILFNVTDGNDWDSELITINVKDVNRAPIIESIGNKIIKEDHTEKFAVSANDADGDNLIYNIINKDKTKVDCLIDGNEITLNPVENWYGSSSCEVRVSDGKGGEDSEEFTIEVTSVNDAPILEPISSKEVEEEDLVRIEAHASDIDGDTLIFDIDDSRFVQVSDGIFEWQTDYDDYGIYDVEVSVNDGNGGEDSKLVEVIVIEVNSHPVFGEIKDLFIDEDSGFFEDGFLNATDIDGFISNFEVVFENKDEVDCTVSDSKLGVKPGKDFSGNATCRIRAYDNDGDWDESEVIIVVNNINDAPKITDYSPISNRKISGNENLGFFIDWNDVDNPKAEVIVRWFVDGVEKGLGETFVFEGEGIENSYDIKVEVTDFEGLSDFHEWILTTSNLPIADTYDGNTTNFSAIAPEDLQSYFPLILERIDVGKIEFLEPVNLSKPINFDIYADIRKWAAGVDTLTINELAGISARITFYNLPYEKQPLIYHNEEFEFTGGEICSEGMCSNVVYENNDLSFEVSGFSSYIIEELPSCSDLSGYVCSENMVCEGNWLEASDSNRCCSEICERAPPEFDDALQCLSKSPFIEINIKEPDSKEDFKIGEIIEVEIDIENNFEDKREFDLETHLYDIDEEESIVEKGEDDNIKAGDEEKFEYEIEIPDDIEDNDFVIYVYVEDENGNCNSDYVNIDIEREKHKVIIEELNLNPSSISLGGKVGVEAKIKNIGKNDEDVVLIIENENLGIYEESEEFELEEYDEDDEITKIISIDIPLDAKKGDYEIKARVVFDDGEEYESKTLSIKALKDFDSIDLDSITLNKLILLSDESTSSSSGGRIYLNKGTSSGTKSSSADYDITLFELNTISGSDRGKDVISIQTEEKKEPAVYFVRTGDEDRVLYSNFLFDLTATEALLILDIFLIIGIIIEIILIVKVWNRI